jgi:hypothetical protein
MTRRGSTCLTMLLALAVACTGDDGAAEGGDTSAPASDSWRVSATGVGPVRVGMTLAEANEVIGGRLAAPEPLEPACDYITPRGLPGDVAFMIVEDRVARLDVRDSTVLTEAGARVGDSEAHVQSLYPGRITVEPHKYVRGGHYLIVAVPGDTLHELLFETDGRTVTEYRAGRRPEVEWVEGCS